MNFVRSTDAYRLLTDAMLPISSLGRASSTKVVFHSNLGNDRAAPRIERKIKIKEDGEAMLSKTDERGVRSGHKREIVEQSSHIDEITREK